MSSLPIVSVLPALFAAIDDHASVILQAPPGAGKSTLLPLELVRQNRLPGRIIMLEPRRLAARNIAGFLARQLGEKVGERIGLRVRGESRTSAATRLEIVTEGVLTRMLQQDPELTGVSLVIFDEFHERSLHADTALAFAIESQQGLRDDLKLLVMSATLDGMALERLLPEAPVVRSEGRGFPIDYHYRPANRQQWLEPQVGAVVLEALAAHGGSLLVFLPGQGDRAAGAVAGRAAAGRGDPRPLYGRLDMAAQQAAIEPAPAGRRKLVLTTNVAETSLTIEGSPWWSTAGWSGAPPSTSRAASPGWRPAPSPKPPPPSGRVVPVVSAPVSATGSGAARCRSASPSRARPTSLPRS